MNRWTVAVLAGLLTLTAGCAGVGPAGSVGDGPAPTAEDVPAERVHTVSVVEVVDGDTMEIRYRNGSTDTVRLLGVDTPEVGAEPQPAEYDGVPDTAAGREWLREWGHRASEFARTELAGEEVRIVVDARSDVRGAYGRLLVYVHVDGDLFNRALLEQGYARMYNSQFSRRTTFGDTEARAQARSVGLWGFGEGATGTPGDAAAIEVAEIHTDATGDDHENLDDEYVVFENTGEPALALSGLTVRDEAGHTYLVPEGIVLEPGGRVTLYTGAGSDTDTSLCWHGDGAIRNNGGDTIVVARPDGEQVLATSYG
jgi:micrococcal nuclease